jgi:hypothetical protein
MLDAAFPGQRCVDGLGAKLDYKGSIAWQKGWRLKHNQTPQNCLWVCDIFILSSVEDDRGSHRFRDTAVAFNSAACDILLDSNRVHAAATQELRSRHQPLCRAPHAPPLLLPSPPDGGDQHGWCSRVVVDISWLILLCIYGRRSMRGMLACLRRAVLVRGGGGSLRDACQGTTSLSYAKAAHGAGALHHV